MVFARDRVLGLEAAVELVMVANGGLVHGKQAEQDNSIGKTGNLPCSRFVV